MRKKKNEFNRSAAAFAFAVAMLGSGALSVNASADDSTAAENPNYGVESHQNSEEVKKKETISIDLGGASSYNVFVKNDYRNLKGGSNQDIGNGHGSIAVGGSATISPVYNVKSYYVNNVVSGAFQEESINDAESTTIDFGKEFESLSQLSDSIAKAFPDDGKTFCRKRNVR